MNSSIAMYKPVSQKLGGAARRLKAALGDSCNHSPPKVQRSRFSCITVADEEMGIGKSTKNAV